MNPSPETSASNAAPGRTWWEHPVLLAFLVLLSAVPLLYPQIPPLVDLPGHMGRFHVQTTIGGSPVLQHFYSFRWQLIGNLGLDLLIIPFAKIFGVELGT